MPQDWFPPTQPIEDEWSPPTQPIVTAPKPRPTSTTPPPSISMPEDKYNTPKMLRGGLLDMNVPLRDRAYNAVFGKQEGAETGLDTPVLPEWKSQPETFWGGFGKSIYNDMLRPFTSVEGIIGSSMPGPKPKVPIGQAKGIPPPVNRMPEIARMQDELVGLKAPKADIELPTISSAPDIKSPLYAGPERRINPDGLSRGMPERRAQDELLLRPSDRMVTDARQDELLNKLGGRQPVNDQQALGAVGEIPGNTIPQTSPVVQAQPNITRSIGNVSEMQPEMGLQGGGSGTGSIKKIVPQDEPFNPDTLFPSKEEVLDSQFRRGMLEKEAGEARKTQPTERTLHMGGDVGPVKFSERLRGEKGELKLDFSNSDFVRNLKESIDKEGTISTVGNTMRASMASADMSAPFRQGLTMVHKKEFWNNLAPMARMFKDEKTFTKIMDDVAKSPTYKMKVESGLDLTGVPGFGKREEQFLNPLAESIPVFGRLVRASDRAYTGFLTKLRSDVFDSLIKDANAIGRQPGRMQIKDVVDKDGFITGTKKAPSDLSKAIATYVNAATGRGPLLESLEPAAKVLNATFFSPRLMASRLWLLKETAKAPISYFAPNYIKQDPFVRKEILKSMGALTGAVTTMAGLAKMAGADVSLDPTSSDFLKAKIGNTRIDFGGGFQQYLVLFSRLAQGKTTSSTSGRSREFNDGFNAPTGLSTAYKFMESKEAPLTSLVTTWLKGTDWKGEDIKWGNEVASRFVPMILQDIKDIAADDPKALPLAIPGLFGASVQTYKNPNRGLSMPNMKLSMPRVQ